MALTDTSHHDERIAKMALSSFYPHYVNKVEKKGRTEAELREVICWLTGYSDDQLQAHLDNKSDVETFFGSATLHPNAGLIKGVICGYRVEDITNKLTQQARYMDKLVDELAKGKKMEKVLRTA